MKEKFILITDRSSDIDGRTPYMSDANYNSNILHNQVLAINFDYESDTDKNPAIIQLFYNLCYDKQVSMQADEIDLKLKGFNISKNDSIYILHHCGKNEQKEEINNRIQSFFSGIGFVKVFVYPYSSEVNNSTTIPFVEIFENNPFNLTSIKKKIKATKPIVYSYVLKEEAILEEIKRRKNSLAIPNFCDIYLLEIRFLTTNIFNDLYRKKMPSKYRGSNSKKPRPIVFIGLFNYFNEPAIEIPEEIKKSLDPRYRFFDSSIWFRYIPLDQVEESFPKHIKYLSEKEQYFQLSEAIEFREFAIRQFNQSYIVSVWASPSCS